MLENCNKVFENPKQKKVNALVDQQRKDQGLPDLDEAWRKLCAEVNMKVILIIDAIDRMTSDDQLKLFTSFGDMLHTDTIEQASPVRVVAASRLGTAFWEKATGSTGVSVLINTTLHRRLVEYGGQ